MTCDTAELTAKILQYTGNGVPNICDEPSPSGPLGCAGNVTRSAQSRVIVPLILGDNLQ